MIPFEECQCIAGTSAGSSGANAESAKNVGGAGNTQTRSGDSGTASKQSDANSGRAGKQSTVSAEAGRDATGGSNAGGGGDRSVASGGASTSNGAVSSNEGGSGTTVGETATGNGGATTAGGSTAPGESAGAGGTVASDGAGGTNSGGTTNEPSNQCEGIPLIDRAQYLTPQDVTCSGMAIEPGCAKMNLFIMLDRSASMNTSIGSDSTRWEEILEGLQLFLELPETADLGIGLGLFSLDGTTDKVANCSVAEYAQPVVAIDLASTVGDSLLNAAASIWPIGLTPTPAALTGALQYASTYALAHPERETAVLLVTDGYPTLCFADNEDPSELISQSAEAAFEGDPSIRTFIFAVDSDASFDSVAVAGGTRTAFAFESDSSLGSDFSSQLSLFTSRDRACRLELPEPTGPISGISSEKLRLMWQSPTGTSEEIPQVPELLSADVTGGRIRARAPRRTEP